jgi:hypothetical protein
LTTEPPVLARRACLAALADSRAGPYASSVLIVASIYICAPRLSTSTRHDELTWPSRARSALVRHASSMKARNTPGTSMTQARDIASDLGLHIGAGDGNRTRTISLGIHPSGPLTVLTRAADIPVVPSSTPATPGLMARQGPKGRQRQGADRDLTFLAIGKPTTPRLRTGRSPTDGPRRLPLLIVVAPRRGVHRPLAGRS